MPHSATKAGRRGGSLLLQGSDGQTARSSIGELFFLLKKTKQTQASTESHLGNADTMLALLNTMSVISTQDCPS